ncbi:MAG: [Fe-S]-binding protein [Spirochaetes bacterium]|nr:[Fe-S]-binding protein [Spirochaetota bacterium]
MPKVLRARDMSKCIGCFSCMNVCAAFNYKNHSLKKSCIHVKTSGGLEGRFVATVCLACREAACAEECPTAALLARAGGGVNLKEELCIGCRRCLQACTALAVSYDEDTGKPVICRHCGICSRYCPHDCLIMEESAQ